MHKRGHLPRLDSAHYRAYAMVHWIMSAKERRTGWLTDRFHAFYREVLLHACCRYSLFCPVYCMMPDHIHLIWVGVGLDADQQDAMKFLKRYAQPAMRPAKLQKQSYDNVLREEDRKRDAFQSTCFYILENPVRKGLAAKAADWPYSGCMVPGYPDLSPHETGYWDIFWKLYATKWRGTTPLR